MPPNMCRLCSNLNGRDLEFSTTDDQKSHAQSHLFQLGYIFDENRADFKQIFDRCFPPQSVESNSYEENEKSRLILLKRCHYVLKDRNNNSGQLICQECRKSVPHIRIYSDGVPHIDARSILEHACLHLDKKPSKCRHCNSGVLRCAKIYRHLKKVHNIISPSREKDISERWAVDFDAIVAILNKCYGGFDKNSERMSRTPFNNRHQLCFELVKKYAGNGTKIDCQLCRKAILVRNKHYLHYRAAIAHVLTHLKKPLYNCTKCSASFVSRTGAHFHAKHQHKSSFAKIIDDRSDKYHADIMDMLSKCYNKKSSA